MAVTKWCVNVSESTDAHGRSVAILTRGCNSVLPGGLVVTQGEQHGLDGADEDPGQEAVENDIERKDFDCGEEKIKKCQNTKSSFYDRAKAQQLITV